MNEHLPMTEEEKKVKAQLQQAIRKTEVPPYLESRVRYRIRETGRPRTWFLRWSPVGVALVVCLGVYIAYELGHLRWTVDAQNAYIASVSRRVSGLMSVGLSDHIHCAVYRKFRKNPPTLERLRQTMPPEYRGLIEVVRERVPPDFRLMIAHQCSYLGRKFVHLALKSDSKVLSVVVASKRDGESFRIQEVAPALHHAGLTIYQESVQRFEIAAMESRDHLVYVISDLPGDENNRIMLSLAPGLRDLLQEMEG